MRCMTTIAFMICIALDVKLYATISEMPMKLPAQSEKPLFPTLPRPNPFPLIVNLNTHHGWSPPPTRLLPNCKPRVNMA